MNGIKTKILEYVFQFLLVPIPSHLSSRLPAPSPHSTDDLESPSSQPQPSPSNTTSESQSPPSPSNTDDLEAPSSQPQPSPSNTTSESQSPPSPESPSGVRELPHTISESQRNNILDAKLDLEKELKKTLLSLCFGAALQIATQCKQVAESEINRSTISLFSLGTATIFASLFTSHFIGENMPTASRMLDKVAFFLAATTFFFAIATPCPLGIKCAIWAVYIISLIAIAACNFLLYSGGELRALLWRQ